MENSDINLAVCSFFFSPGFCCLIARCHERVMDDKSNEIWCKMPHLAKDNETIVS